MFSNFPSIFGFHGQSFLKLFPLINNHFSNCLVVFVLTEVEDSGRNTGGADNEDMMEDAESPISPIVLSPSGPDEPRPDTASPVTMETEPVPSPSPPAETTPAPAAAPASQ